MSRKSKKIISFIFIILCVASLVTILNYERVLTILWPSWESIVDSKDDFSPANSLDECIILASTTNEEVKIKPFALSDGSFHLVLPSMANSFRFANLSDECSLMIDGKEVDGNEKISIVEDFDIVLNSNQTLHVLKSDNIPAMFLDVEVEQKVLDAIKGEQFGGECVYIDSNGKTIFSDSFEYISTRGNTTYRYDKKPYNLKLKSDQSLLNNYSSKKWVLLANAMDASLLKNGLVYEFAEEYTDIMHPLGEYIDLYINGDYRGNYYLSNRPQNEEDILKALKLEEYKELSVTGAEEQLTYAYNEERTACGTVGQSVSVPESDFFYLVEFTIWDVTDETSWFETKSGVVGKVVFPRNATLAQTEYIKNALEQLEDAANDENADYHEIEQLLDVPSYASRYLIDNVFQNHDAGIASSWFYKYPDYLDSKIYAGPLWDYDNTMNYDNSISELDTTIVGNVYLSEQLMKMEGFQEYIRKAFYDVYKPYVKYTLPNQIFELNNYIQKSRYLNNLRWEQACISDETLMDDMIEVTQNRMKTVEERLLGEDEYCNVTFFDHDANVARVEVVRRGEPLDEIPIANSWNAIFGGWYNQQDGRLLTAETRIWEDTTFVAKWYDLETILQSGIDSNEVDMESVDIDSLEKTVQLIKEKRGGEQK